MKKIIISIICFFLLAGLGYAGQMKHFTAKGGYFNFSFDYPGDWAAVDMSGFVHLLAPAGAGQEKLRQNILITVGDLRRSPMTLAQFDEYWRKIAPLEFGNFKLLKKENKQIDGKNAWFYLYTGDKMAQTFKYERYAFIEGTNIFEIIYEAPLETFDIYSPVVSAVVASLAAK